MRKVVGKMQKWGKTCPTDESHGLLLPFYDSKSRDAWICPHAGHARSPPPTRSTFTDEEADGHNDDIQGGRTEKPATLLVRGKATGSARTIGAKT